MSRHGNLRTLLVALASAIVLVGLILCAFFVLTRSSRSRGITLPEAEQPGTAAEPGNVEEGLFLQVTPDTVARVVETLNRAGSYHQTLTLTTVWTDGDADRTAELWVSGSVCRVDVTDGDTVRSCLSDGETAYVWYQDDQSVAELTLGSDFTLDDLMGIPTYETILTVATDTICDAGYVTLDEMDGRSCIYAQLDDGSGYIDSYWIDVSTGLLCRADSLENQSLIYKLRETAVEVLLASDETLTEAFTLPDGTVPFQSE
jgi:hypothetical protein